MFDPSKVPAYLRTIVPSLWGSVLVWLLANAAWIPDAIGAWLATPAVSVTVTSLAIGAWYALWRWLEPRLPAWFTRIVLGSNLTPTYSTTTN